MAQINDMKTNRLDFWDRSAVIRRAAKTLLCLKKKMQRVRTQQTCVWTPADDQVMRFAGADVLQGQQRPVPGRAACPHLGHRFARLDQREDLRGE